MLDLSTPATRWVLGTLIGAAAVVGVYYQNDFFSRPIKNPESEIPSSRPITSSEASQPPWVIGSISIKVIDLKQVPLLEPAGAGDQHLQQALERYLVFAQQVKNCRVVVCG